jgi:hypothetical protein
MIQQPCNKSWDVLDHASVINEPVRLSAKPTANYILVGLQPPRQLALGQVGLGVLQYVSRKPLLFALEHCKGCYRDYQWWLTVRKPGEHYVRPEQREAADFGE